MRANNSGIRALAAISIAALVSFAGNASGQLRESQDFLFNEEGESETFKSKSARALMTANDYLSYSIYLEALDCTSARALLNVAFVRAYPEFVRVKTPEIGKDISDYLSWVLYSIEAFPEFGFCEAVVTFQQGEAELAAEGVQGKKYRSLPFDELTDNTSTLLEMRHGGISGIILSSVRDYPPALTMLAELVRRGDLFDAGADVEFLLLARACHLGHRCAEHRARITELRSYLSTDRQAAIAAKARSQLFELFSIIDAGTVDWRSQFLRQLSNSR